MSIRKLFVAGSIAATGLAISTAAVLAFSPFNIGVVRNSDVYANRNQNTSAVVNHIEAGQTVKVTQMKPFWCFIQIPGDDGWVKCDVLGPWV